MTTTLDSKVDICRFLALLRQLGWHVLSPNECVALRRDGHDLILRPRLEQFLNRQRLPQQAGTLGLSEAVLEQVFLQLDLGYSQTASFELNRHFYNFLTQGITVTELLPNDTPLTTTIPLLDWETTTANSWDIAVNMTIKPLAEGPLRTLDVVCFVNGLPLAIILLDMTPNSPAEHELAIQQLIDKHLRYQSPHDLSGVYAYSQLLLALTPHKALYGTTGTPPDLWTAWREERATGGSIQQPAELFQQASLEPITAKAAESLIVVLLAPHRLLALVRNYIVFSRAARQKLIARSYQFFAVQALLQQIQQRRSAGPEIGGRLGGVLEQAPYTGCRLSVIFLAQALLLHTSFRACRVVIISSDARLITLLGSYIDAELAELTHEELEHTLHQPIGSGRKLARYLGHSKVRLMIASARKFFTALQQPECYNPSADIIILNASFIDSSSNKFTPALAKTLPRAALLSLVHPLPVQPLTPGRQARPVNPRALYTYTLSQAVEDGFLCPILYEKPQPTGSLPSSYLHTWLTQRVETLAATQRAYLVKSGADYFTPQDRIQPQALIAWDIARHFSQTWPTNMAGPAHDNKTATAKAVKGLLLVEDEGAARQYKDLLQTFGLVNCALIHQPIGYSPDLLLAWDLATVLDRNPTVSACYKAIYLAKPTSLEAVVAQMPSLFQNSLQQSKRLLIDYRELLYAGSYIQPANANWAEVDPQVGALYRPYSELYKQLSNLQQKLWALFPGLTRADGIAAFQQVLQPCYRLDGAEQLVDTQQTARVIFSTVLAKLQEGMQLAQTSYVDQAQAHIKSDLLPRYQKDLSFFMALQASLNLDLAKAKLAATAQLLTGRANADSRRTDLDNRPEPQLIQELSIEARPYLALIQHLFGEQHFRRQSTQQLAFWCQEAVFIQTVVTQAAAEHSLHPKDMQTTIRTKLLPRLATWLAWDDTQTLLRQIIQYTRLILNLDTV